MQRRVTGPVFSRGNTDTKTVNTSSNSEIKNKQSRAVPSQVNVDNGDSDDKLFEDIIAGSPPKKTLHADKAKFPSSVYSIRCNEAANFVSGMNKIMKEEFNEEYLEANDKDLLQELQTLSILMMKFIRWKNDLQTELHRRDTLNSIRKEETTEDEVTVLNKKIRALESQLNHTTTSLIEVNMKHKAEIHRFVHENNKLRAQIHEFYTENEALKTKSTKQEKKLLQVPRMEEHYLRAARVLVKQKDFAMIAQNKKWQKVQDEVIALNYWKETAKLLQGNVNDLHGHIRQVERQNRVYLRQYQDLLSNRSMERPQSAPTHRIVADADIVDNEEDLKYSQPATSHGHDGEESSPRRRTNRANDEAKSDVLKLINKNAALEKKVATIAQQLAAARSCPLRTLSGEENDMFMSNESHQRAHTSHGHTSHAHKPSSHHISSTIGDIFADGYEHVIPKVNKKDFFQELVDADDDENTEGNDDDEDEFDIDADGNLVKRTKNIFDAEYRLQRAQRIQQSYMDRITKSRTNFSNEQQSVRQSASFKKQS